MNKDVGKHYKDSEIEQTHKTFDHHVYEVIFNSDNGSPEKKTEMILARNVCHLMSVLETDGNYPKGHLVNSIKEIAYVPTCYILLNKTRIKKEFK